MMAPACLFYALMFLTCCVIVEGKGDESHPHLFFNPSSQVGADCPNCLPGVELLGMGWDATTGLHRPLRIVEFTFNNDFKFKNPQSGEIFAVPDQANAIPYTHLEAESINIVAYSAEELSHSLSSGVNLGVGVDWGLGLFSASAAVKTASKYLSTRTSFSSYAYSTEAASVYQAILSHPNQLNYTNSFLIAMNGLPEVYDQDAYQDFIRSFGTHYLRDAYFGGFGCMTVAVNAEQAELKSEQAVAVQAGIQFRFLKANASGESASSWFLGSRQQTSYISTSLVGGRSDLGTDLKNWNLWLKSFYKYPAVITSSHTFPYTAEPLYNTFSNPITQENMKKAVVSYLKSNPFPPAPPCRQQVYCPEMKQCCPANRPYCCPKLPGGCATSELDCNGYYLLIQEVQKGLCDKHACRSTKKDRTLQCNLGGSGWFYTLECNTSGICTFSSHKGPSCSFRVGQTSCFLNYKLGCDVYAKASLTEL